MTLKEVYISLWNNNLNANKIIIGHICYSKQKIFHTHQIFHLKKCLIIIFFTSIAISKLIVKYYKTSQIITCAWWFIRIAKGHSSSSRTYSLAPGLPPGSSWTRIISFPRSLLFSQGLNNFLTVKIIFQDIFPGSWPSTWQLLNNNN